MFFLYLVEPTQAFKVKNIKKTDQPYFKDHIGREIMELTLGWELTALSYQHYLLLELYF